MINRRNHLRRNEATLETSAILILLFYYVFVVLYTPIIQNPDHGMFAPNVAPSANSRIAPPTRSLTGTSIVLPNLLRQLVRTSNSSTHPTLGSSNVTGILGSTLNA